MTGSIGRYTNWCDDAAVKEALFTLVDHTHARLGIRLRVKKRAQEGEAAASSTESPGSAKKPDVTVGAIWEIVKPGQEVIIEPVIIGSGGSPEAWTTEKRWGAAFARCLGGCCGE